MFLTSNGAKVAWANQLARVHNSRIRFIRKRFRFEESQSTDVAQVAKSKFMQAADKVAGPLIVEDSGLYLDAFKGFPATHTKFVLSAIGVAGVLKLFRGLPRARRGYRIRSVICYTNGQSGVRLFAGEGRGTVSPTPKGNNYHGWGAVMSILVPRGRQKTLAQFNDGEWAAYATDVNKGDAFTVALGRLLRQRARSWPTSGSGGERL
jgi:XTP/dITP diphosphohydrolase